MAINVTIAKELIMYSKEIDYGNQIKLIVLSLFLLFSVFSILYTRKMKPKTSFQEYIKRIIPIFSYAYIIFTPLMAFLLQPGINESTILKFVIITYGVALSIGMILWFIWNMDFVQEYLGIPIYKPKNNYRRVNK